VVGIDVAEQGDPLGKARGFQEKHHLTYPILVDSEGKAQRAFGIDAFPTNIILDREGKVRYVEAGFNPAAIDKTLQDLIAPG
jgi:peroxiredoxin